MSLISRFFRRRRRARRSSENYLKSVSVGRHTYGVKPQAALLSSAAAPLKVGSFCSIGAEVTLLCAGHHRTDAASTFPIPDLMLGKATPATAYGRGVGITIGNDVWIGYRALILPGVTIGDGAIIGAGAVVARDVEPYAVVAGNPARVLRSRFDAATVGKLRAIRWWEWSDEKIKAEADWLTGPIDDFIARHWPAGVG